jgi:hypothetical protein
MSISNQFVGFYGGATGIGSLSSDLQDQFQSNADPGASGILSDTFISQSEAGVSNQLEDFAGTPVIYLGIDSVTGQARPMQVGDSILNTSGDLFAATGVHGVTGVYGVTGTAPQGVTGVLGDTGIAGNTGIFGATGIRGLRGPRGFTGLRGNTGLLGATGTQGQTGIAGIEGFRFFGETGVAGNTGLRGPTGLSIRGNTGIGHGFTGVVQGITGLAGNVGINTSSQGITGLQGLAGSTGLQGITGMTLGGNQGPLKTLSAQTPSASSASFNVEGGTLSANGQYLKIISFGQLTVNQGNNVSLQFAGNSIFNNNLYVNADGSFFLVYHLIRNTGVTDQLHFVEMYTSYNTRRVVRATSSDNLSVDNSIELSIDGTISAFIVRHNF